jgi:hypothetical protein
MQQSRGLSLPASSWHEHIKSVQNDNGMTLVNVLILHP